MHVRALLLPGSLIGAPSVWYLCVPNNGTACTLIRQVESVVSSVILAVGGVMGRTQRLSVGVCGGANTYVARPPELSLIARSLPGLKVGLRVCIYFCRHWLP